MSNFRKFISLSAVAMLGVTNLLTPLSYASAATKYDNLSEGELATHNLTFEMPDKDVYLYAHTEANHYFVEYSGTTKTSGTMPNSEFIYDQPDQHLSGNAYAKTGYTFSGWNTDPNGGGTGYADEALVDNWTTVESGTVPIYAQWNPNRYYITYNLNDNDGGTSSGVHSGTPTSGLYDEELTIQHPSRTGYVFSGWYITDMDNETHIISGAEHHGTTDDHEMATSYENLHASGGTVNFMARWDKGVVEYLVKHYKETFTGGDYTILVSEHTVNGTGLADEQITPEVHTYEGFTTPAAVTTGIKADGSTYVEYHYDRNSYTLTMNAGRGIDSVTATGEHNTVGVTTPATATGSFKYDDQVELSFVLGDGYENPQWSGSNNNASSFTMPAENISKTAYATPIVYTITYDYLNGKPDNNPTTYTIESGQIVIPALDRTHSYFDGWIGGVYGGEQLASAQQSVTIPAGSTGNRTYTATWSCYPKYHLSPDNSACLPDSDTEYRVKHYLQDFDGQYNILSGPSIGYTIQTGVTDEVTDAHALTFTGFKVATIDTGIINGYELPSYSGITYVDIHYDRLNYTGSVEITTGVTSITHVGANDGENDNPSGHHQYDDVVTITATTGAGYTFSGWTIKDGSGNDITDQLLSNPGDITTTFNMPASPVVIKANVTTNVYNLTIISHGGENGSTSGTYTVETTVELTNPTRDHSDFAGWSGTEVTDPMHVIFSGRAYDSVYEETWKCHTGYHMSGADECVANTYHVIEADVDGEGHGAPDDIYFTYDQTGTLPVMPSQSGYDFIGWTVEGMSGGVTHYIGEITVNSDDTYTYSGTSLDFMNLTVENGGTVTLTARWAPRDDTDYVIYHYYRNVNETTYSLSGTDELSGTTDTDVVFAQHLQNYSGFTYTGGFVNISNPGAGLPSEGKVTTGNIEKDGSTKIYLYYDRNRYDVNLSGDAHVATLTGNGTYDFEADVTVDMTAETGYHFRIWEKSDSERHHS